MSTKGAILARAGQWILEAALGIEAQPLLRIQLDYNIQQTKKSKPFLQCLVGIKHVAAVF